ncbi:mycofactocin-coupled SDR family oxidoreductase [Amycolatopsis cynarae]|uniref:Mycofactocin-coupled SDR family oxidoreductase n=1 Tax=Amycolatopsis cynarae TaxID=2995223 RepID=A0ABY7BBK7_9PSEU|nr:mycofactocin-coupled SDR family oxidoreductase [Amycolatopsis sp. HUAS 11-8]WAL68251.1 mycofactocin-coupled SDR family oxidoreductase [Amycolatopsis sp. HUAS 11-8]
MGRVEGKVAFVTGAARGQGRAHAVRLAEEGADIIALDLCADVATAAHGGATKEDLDETVRQVEALGRRIVARVGDVRDSDALEATVADGVAELGRLDIICANAGIAGFGPALELSPQTWQDMIDINLTGVWRTVRAAAPAVVAGGRGGSIVLTSSIAGMIGFPNVAHYAAAKHGLVGLMRVLAMELAPERIRVNTVHPTNVDTDMIQNEYMWSFFTGGQPGATQADAAVPMQLMHALPVPWVESIDIANAVLWLASDEARYVTGVVLPVDAGCTHPFKAPHKQ